MSLLVGAGGMVLSFAKALKEQNINYQQELLVEATDISDICVYMAYIQLSLYGIPAVVYCGDTLLQEIRFKLETPLFYLNYWKFRKFHNQNTEDESEEVQENESKYTIETTTDTQNLLKEVIVKGNIQFSLW
ncbi:MAG: hypothetical protein HFJ52_08820 [Clostridia bacterium]|nr:hypothetical protein [Clostridia bacterium]